MGAAMMLSRVADHLYWIGRYLERAEHTARLLDVNLDLMLDQSPASHGQRWQYILQSLNIKEHPDISDNFSAAKWLTLEINNQSSIIASVHSARENARQVREQMSSEMWEQVNRTFLHLKGVHFEEVWYGQPREFFRTVKESIHLFEGISYSTMNHEKGWYFIHAGRYIERAIAISKLLDTHYSTFSMADNMTGVADYLEWISLLKSCTAFEAYCKVYSADIQAGEAVEFLLLNPTFPHSVCFSVYQVQRALDNFGNAAETRQTQRVKKLAGRLRASLDFGQLDEIVHTGLHSYLHDIQQQCSRLHEAIYRAYIEYPINRDMY